jgi:small subunit ribosomal protein S1
VTKVVTFGAFVEILPGVEGLVHISELAQHHVENPREVVSQGQDVKVLILEVDAERRRLSLSMKRVDGEPGEEGDGDEGSQLTPNLGLSAEVFAEGSTAPAEESEVLDEAEASAEPLPEAPAEEEAVAEAEAELEPEAVAEAAKPEPEAVAEVEAEPEAELEPDEPQA